MVARVEVRFADLEAVTSAAVDAKIRGAKTTAAVLDALSAKINDALIGEAQDERRADDARRQAEIQAEYDAHRPDSTSFAEWEEIDPASRVLLSHIAVFLNALMIFHRHDDPDGLIRGVDDSHPEATTLFPVLSKKSTANSKWALIAKCGHYPTKRWFPIEWGAAQVRSLVKAGILQHPYGNRTCASLTYYGLRTIRSYEHRCALADESLPEGDTSNLPKDYLKRRTRRGMAGDLSIGPRVISE